MNIRRLLILPLLVASLAACGGSDGQSSSTSASNAVPSDSVETTPPSSNATDTSNAAPSTMTKIRVTVGVDSGPDRIENVKLNQPVELTLVNPNADDEFHVHGYDLGGGKTRAGEEKTFAFTATEAGDFEVESHVTETVLVVLHVS